MVTYLIIKQPARGGHGNAYYDITDEDTKTWTQWGLPEVTT